VSHPGRREALSQLAALLAVPLARWATAGGDPLDGTIADYQAGRLRGDWTALEVTRRALDRATARGAALRAIDQLAHDALDAARAADARLRSGAPCGPLDGVPVLAKSIHDVRGLPTTASSAAWAALFPEPARRDAIEVARLRAAGAVILGQAAADDFAYRGIGESSRTGRVRNPYDLADARTAGGSSAGAAVAAACGIAFGGLGTDDGGSNRIPAQCCGVVGVKPTFGRVPRTGTIPTWPLLDTHGPLARTVADAVRLLDATAGPDGADRYALPNRWAPAADRVRDDALAGARLGVVAAHVPRAQMTSEACALWDRAVGDLRAAGATVDEVEPPITLATYRARFTALARAVGDPPPEPRPPARTARALLDWFAGRDDAPLASLERGYATYRQWYDALPLEWPALRALLDAPEHADPAGEAFLRARRATVSELTAWMGRERLDALVYPTMPFAPFGSDGRWPDVRTPLGFGNWLGLPEVSVPAGLGAEGVPGLNCSVVGLPGDDARVLAYAHAYERQSRRFVAPPAG
jgi:aspartyl-tRNA(Asn)/glutamyl-tRNA(Gln) amidotransferase subunit A